MGIVIKYEAVIKLKGSILDHVNYSTCDGEVIANSSVVSLDNTSILDIDDSSIHCRVVDEC